MAKIRQKIKVGEFEVVILNYEAQDKLVITVVDKNRDVVGSLKVSNKSDTMQFGTDDFILNLN